MKTENLQIREIIKEVIEGQSLDNHSYTNGLKKLENIIDLSAKPEVDESKNPKRNFRFISMTRYGLVLGCVIIVLATTFLIYPITNKDNNRIDKVAVKDTTVPTQTLAPTSAKIDQGKIKIVANAAEAKELLTAELLNLTSDDAIVYYKQSSKSTEAGGIFSEYDEYVKDNGSSRKKSKTLWRESGIDDRIRMSAFDGKTYFNYWNDTYINTLDKQTYNGTSDNTETKQTYCGETPIQVRSEGRLSFNPMEDMYKLIIESDNYVLKQETEGDNQFYVIENQNGTDGNSYNTKYYFTLEFKFAKSTLEFYQDFKLLNRIVTIIDDYQILPRTEENLKKYFEFNEVVDDSFTVNESVTDCKSM